MRAIRCSLLIFASCVPLFCFGQANWTPGLTEEKQRQEAKKSSQLWGISVSAVTLSPQEAREQYNIDIAAPQQFVLIQHIESDSNAARHGGPSVWFPQISVGDLVDAVVFGGEMPRHGNVNSVADWNRYVSLCSQSCLLLVRHKFDASSNLNSFGATDTNFFVRNAAAIYPYQDLFISFGLCDKTTKYYYLPHLPPAGMPIHNNWLSPEEFPTVFGLKSCDLPEPIRVTGNMATTPAAPINSNTVPQEIAQIRSAPHAAMPPAQSSPAPLGGKTGMTIENGTAYTLHFYLTGPITQSFQIAPNSAQTLNVPPGNYEIAARVSDPSVIPFYGTEACATNTKYAHHFYISTQRQ